MDWGSVPLHEELKAQLPILEKILLNGGLEEEDEKRQLGSVMYRDDAMWAAGIHDVSPSEQDEEEVEEGYEHDENDTEEKETKRSQDGQEVNHIESAEERKRLQRSVEVQQQK